MEYSGFLPDLNKAELYIECSSTTSSIVREKVRKQKSLLSLRFYFWQEVVICSDTFCKKKSLLMQHYPNTFHSDNEVFPYAPIKYHVTAHTVTLPKPRHNP